MRKQAEYKGVEDSVGGLEKTVNKLLNEGWEVIGPAQPTTIRNQLAQTLVRFEQAAEPTVGKLEYATADDLAELQARIVRRLAEGWRVYGNLLVIPDGDKRTYCQAFVS